MEMHPEVVRFHDSIADIYEQKKMFRAAFAERQQAVCLNGDARLAASLEQVYQQFRIQRIRGGDNPVPRASLKTRLRPEYVPGTPQRNIGRQNARSTLS